MEIVCIEGSAPGSIVATLAHHTRVRQIPMVVARHPAGGWHVAGREGAFGPRCHAVATAVLLEAADLFVEADSASALN